MDKLRLSLKITYKMEKIIHGDCLEEMKKINDNTVDLVLIDPPYNIKIDEWDNIGGLKEKIELNNEGLISDKKLKGFIDGWNGYSNFANTHNFNKKLEKVVTIE